MHTEKGQQDVPTFNEHAGLFSMTFEPDETSTRLTGKGMTTISTGSNMSGLQIERHHGDAGADRNSDLGFLV